MTQPTEAIDVITFGGGGVAVWQAVKEGVIALIPSPGVVAGGIVGAIPLILHAKNVGEGSDVIPLPTTPVDATPAKPDDGPPTEPDDPKGPGRRPPFPHSKKGDEELPEEASKRVIWPDKVITPWQREVYQRSDIDWNLNRPDGAPLAGRTNWEAGQQGYAPVRINSNTNRGWEEVNLHHVNEDPRGAIVETWRTTHGKVPHRLDPPGAWRKSNPRWADAWNAEQSAYWKWRTGAYNPEPTDELLLPGDPGYSGRY